VYGETIECEGMIYEREMSSAGGGKQLRKVMTECPMAENSRERMQPVVHNSRRPGFIIPGGPVTAPENVRK